MDQLTKQNVSDGHSAESLRTAIDGYLQELFEIKESSGRMPRDKIVELSSRYWNLISEVIIGRCSSDGVGDLTFTEEEERFICFGAPPPVLSSDAEVLTSDTAMVPRLFCLSEWLRKSYLHISETVSVTEKQKRNKELKAEVEEARRKLKKQQAFRDNLINLYCNDGSNEALFLSKRMEVVHEDIARYELLPTFNIELSQADTEQLEALKQLDDKMRKEFSELAGRIGKTGMVDAIERVIGFVEKGMRELKRIELELERAVQDVEDSADHTSYVSDRKKRISLVQELYDLKNGLESYCAANKSFLKSVFLPPSRMVGIKILRSVLNRLIEYDPRIFNNISVFRKGFPDFLVLPFEGTPFYDADKNFFIIPLVMREKTLKMMARMMATYRVETDCSFALRDNYMMKRRDRAPLRSKETNEMFIEDYVLWQTRDTCGESDLSPEVRQWFEGEIAPYFNELRLLPGFILKSEDERDHDTILKSLKQALRDNPKDHISRFNCGVLFYMAGSYAPAAREFETILAAKPSSLQALYNYAIVSEMMNKKSGAVVAWERYLMLDRGSWWRDNAEKHLDRLRSASDAK